MSTYLPSYLLYLPTYLPIYALCQPTYPPSYIPTDLLPPILIDQKSSVEHPQCSFIGPIRVTAFGMTSLFGKLLQGAY